MKLLGACYPWNLVKECECEYGLRLTKSQMCTRAAWPGRSLEKDDNLEFKFYSIKMNRVRRLLLCKALKCT